MEILITENDTTIDNQDTIAFDRSINKDDIAIFMQSGNLQIGLVCPQKIVPKIMRKSG